MKKKKKKNKNILIGSLIIILCSFFFALIQIKEEARQTNSEVLSTKKIEWGVKRNDDHKQPDLGSTNMKILNAYERNLYGE